MRTVRYVMTRKAEPVPPWEWRASERERRGREAAGNKFEWSGPPMAGYDSLPPEHFP